MEKEKVSKALWVKPSTHRKVQKYKADKAYVSVDDTIIALLKLINK